MAFPVVTPLRQISPGMRRCPSRSGQLFATRELRQVPEHVQKHGRKICSDQGSRYVGKCGFVTFIIHLYKASFTFCSPKLPWQLNCRLFYTNKQNYKYLFINITSPCFDFLLFVSNAHASRTIRIDNWLSSRMQFYCIRQRYIKSARPGKRQLDVWIQT